MFLLKRPDFSNYCKIEDEISYQSNIQLHDKLNKNELDYDLYGIVLHSGKIYGGHYKAMAKKGSKWILFNDSSYNEVEESELQQKNAYILFYKGRE